MAIVSLKRNNKIRNNIYRTIIYKMKIIMLLIFYLLEDTRRKGADLF